MIDHHQAGVVAYIADYLDAIETCEEPPPLNCLPPAAQRRARRLLANINTDPGFEFEVPPAAPDAAERCRLGLPARSVPIGAGSAQPGLYCAEMTATAVEHLNGDALDARMRHIVSRCPQPYPVLLYHRTDTGEDPPLWLASVDAAHDWFYFASSDTPVEALDERLDVLVSGGADSVTGDDWIADDEDEPRLNPPERAEALDDHRTMESYANTKTGLGVVSFTVRSGFSPESLWLHQHRAETDLRPLRIYLNAAREALDQQQRPEQLDMLLDMLESAARSSVSPMDGAERTFGWRTTAALGATEVESAVWHLREALLPFTGRLLASGCDAEAVVAEAAAQRADGLRRALDAWLMSSSLRRIASRDTIFEGRELLPDTHREAVADVEAYMKHPEVQARRGVVRSGERLMQHLRSVAAGGGDTKRARRAASRFLRRAGRGFGVV